MSTARPFAYNTGASIGGTEQVGNLAVGIPSGGFSGSPNFWNGPDEELGYVIAYSQPDGLHPTPISGVTSSVGFWRSKLATAESFLEVVLNKTGQTFATAEEAKTWLNNNGYWTSWGIGTSSCDTFTFIGNNATTTSNSAINDGTPGWDSSAYSSETFTGPVSVTFQTSANGNILMGGFSYNPTATPGNTYEDTSYGIYLYNSDQIEIYENGGQAAVLNVGAVVSSSDVWKVDYDGTSVKYYLNSTLLYTSTNSVTQPLHIFFPLFSPNEGVTNVCVIHQASLVTSGLILRLNASDSASYSGSGSTWTDLEGTQQNITLYNSPTYTSGSPSYFTFNGSNQYGLGSGSVLPTTSYTKSVWFYLNGYADNNIVSGDGHFMFMGANPSVDRKLYCGHSNWGSYVAYPSTSTLNLNTWYYAALTFNTTDGMKLYINGVLDSTYTVNKGAHPGSGNVNVATFNGANLFNGRISKVFCYNRSLTSQEVIDNFNSSATEFGYNTI